MYVKRAKLPYQAVRACSQIHWGRALRRLTPPLQIEHADSQTAYSVTDDNNRFWWVWRGLKAPPSAVMQTARKGWVFLDYQWHQHGWLLIESQSCFPFFTFPCLSYFDSTLTSVRPFTLYPCSKKAATFAYAAVNTLHVVTPQVATSTHKCLGKTTMVETSTSSPTSIPARSSSSGLVNDVRSKPPRQARRLLPEDEPNNNSTTAGMEAPHKKLATVMTDRSLDSETKSSEQAFEKPKLHHRSTIHSIHLDTYFRGPRDLHRHSKWPLSLRLNGSIVPKMILPVVVVAVWATTITCISKLVTDLGINSVLLTVLGFVVALSLSFRSSTAYERYSEGRKYWALLMLESRNLSRFIWINTPERQEDVKFGKADLLGKLTALNLISAFAVALKHRLQFEPAVDYPDLKPLVSHLDTFAGAIDQSTLRPRPETP